MKIREIITLGFMTFALFVGAGNIIFPPFIGLRAGENLWYAAAGFLITGVGLPVLALIAMARKNGSLVELTKPAGKYFGLLLSLICYLALGPLFGTPRTATVSYEIGINPLFSGQVPLSIFSLVFFIAVIICSLNPLKLIDIVGKFLSPLKVVSLGLLGLYAFWRPAGNELSTFPEYVETPFSSGMINGYLTMDTLAALVFSIIIVNAIKSRGVDRAQNITRYMVITGLIAAVGLIYVYISLFYLGAYSLPLARTATNGADVLHAYIVNGFGFKGSVFLAFVITIACLVTAIGLTSACASYFNQITGKSYKMFVVILAAVSMLLSNLGLTEIIRFSLPALTSVYPPFIVLVIYGALAKGDDNSVMLCMPATLVAFVVGIMQSVVPADDIPLLVQHLPFYKEGMGWIVPTLVVFVLSVLCRKVTPSQQVTS